MFLLKGILLFKIYVNRVNLMNTQKKLVKSSKAGTGAGKTYVKFVELKFLFLLFSTLFNANGKKKKKLEQRSYPYLQTTF